MKKMKHYELKVFSGGTSVSSKLLHSVISLTIILYFNFEVSPVAWHIDIDAGGLWFDSRDGQIGHSVANCCDVSSELCCLGAKQALA